jgi:hypothetical protein
MKLIISLFSCAFFLFSCTDPGKQTVQSISKKNDTVEQQHFFPLTAFLKGEIFNIKKSRINPLKYTTENNRTDSVWLKIEEIDAVVREFIEPEIDSLNLTAFFTEKSFFDQTINAVTLTYDPILKLPDTMKLRHWDIYIDPQTNKVRRIYMLKEIDKTKILQLTWVSGKWCKMVNIIKDEGGKSNIEKEEKLVWDF